MIGEFDDRVIVENPGRPETSETSAGDLYNSLQADIDSFRAITSSPSYEKDVQLAYESNSKPDENGLRVGQTVRIQNPDGSYEYGTYLGNGNVRPHNQR